VAITAAFLAVVAAIVIWWLSHQRLAAKPWLEEGVIGDVPAAGAPRVRTAKIGLGVFLAVAGSLFALFSSAYMMRMHMGADWRPLPVPPLLWLNTGVLVASSVALHRAQVAARGGRMDGVRDGLLAGGVLALTFLAGQLLAWRQFLLLPAHSRTRAARARRPRRLGQGDRQVLARSRRGPGAAERRAVRDLLAFPPVRVAGSLRAAAASLEGTGNR
jgi:hypothetical protein